MPAFSPLWSGFEPRSDHKGFAVDKAALEKVSLATHTTDCSSMITIRD
jgi:hypothetical protein